MTAVLLNLPAPIKAENPAAPVLYEPTVESLTNYCVPEWFRDAKLGIFMHWGPQCVSGYQPTWYARWMYEQGSKAYKYHCATYGHPSKFGYKDICKLFKAEKFDQAQADRLTKLYKRIGARYVVPVAAHHDNFDMWDSKYQPRWNSVATAGKDVCGMWKKSADKNGLHFGVASHVARTYRWLQTSHGADKAGPLAGVPYDGQNPEYADLYGVPWKDSGYGYEGPQDVGPPAFEKNFEDRMKDLIDRTHPDLYYTDGGPPFKKAGYNIVSYLYNENQKWHGGKLQALATFKGINHAKPVGIENYEFEYPGSITPHVWQTDKTMGQSWYWVRGAAGQYKKGNEIVHALIDVASKNGNLLLNVTLTPEGELEQQAVASLTDVGKYLDIIGEAVFATRPWDAFGEGIRTINGIALLTPRDIRFTRNKDNTVLYATVMGWPGDGATVSIRTLSKCRINLKGVKSVSLVGAPDRLVYSQNAEALHVTLPAKPPYECCAYPIKLTFSGPLPRLKPPVKMLWQAQVRNIAGRDDRSAYGLAGQRGVLLLTVPEGSLAARTGLQRGDVILACNGKEVRTVDDVLGLRDQAAGQKLSLTVTRNKKAETVELGDYPYLVMETQAAPTFKTVALAPSSAVVPAKVFSGGAPTGNDPLNALIDGKVVKGFGPIFQNGVIDGAYKLDLGAVRSIVQVNTFSSGGRNRAKQNYVLYGSNATSDPGWNVMDAALFTPILAVDTRKVEPKQFVATGIRHSNGHSLGNHRWLVWKVFPVTGQVGGENTAFQELQVMAHPAGADQHRP